MSSSHRPSPGSLLALAAALAVLVVAAAVLLADRDDERSGEAGTVTGAGITEEVAHRAAGACRRRIDTGPRLDPETVAELVALCERIEDARTLEEIAVVNEETCEQVAEATVRAGPVRDRAVAACKQLDRVP